MSTETGKLLRELRPYLKISVKDFGTKLGVAPTTIYRYENGGTLTEASNYNSIDLAKFLMAFCVVAIHTGPMINCEDVSLLSIYDSVVECAVPFFFLASGFLLEKKLRDCKDLSVLDRQLRKILKMYLLWTLIYTPLELIHAFSSGTQPIKEMLIYIRGLVFVGEHYNSWPLWYLLSTIYGLLLVKYLKKHSVSNKGILTICIVIMLLSFGTDFFVSLSNLPLPLSLGRKLVKITIGNGRILRALFFIPLGMLLSYYSNFLLSVILLISGFLGNFFLDGFWSSVLLTVSAVGLFGVILNIKLPNKSVWKHLREYSTIIYLIHMYVWTFYYWFVYGEKTFGLDSFVFTSIASLLISIIYVLVKERRWFPVKK